MEADDCVHVLKNYDEKTISLYIESSEYKPSDMDAILKKADCVLKLEIENEKFELLTQRVYLFGEFGIVPILNYTKNITSKN